MHEYLDDLQQSNYKDRKPNKRNPKDVDEITGDTVNHTLTMKVVRNDWKS